MSAVDDGGLRSEKRPPRAAYNQYIGGSAWRRRREVAIVAASGRCQSCNSPDDLDVHHRTYARFGRERPGDLTVLCAECHQLYHGRYASNGEERVDPWERLLAWCVTELQSALGEAIHRLWREANLSGHQSPALTYALLVDKKVRRRIAASQERERRKRGIFLVVPKVDMAAIMERERQSRRARYGE